MTKKWIAAVDFDGTIVQHRFPRLGNPMPDVHEGLRKLSEKFDIVVWTCRCGYEADEAERFMNEQELPFATINKGVAGWDEAQGCRKIYADIYIDDRNFGGFPGWRAVIDWLEEGGFDEWDRKFHGGNEKEEEGGNDEAD